MANPGDRKRRFLVLCAGTAVLVLHCTGILGLLIVGGSVLAILWGVLGLLAGATGPRDAL